MRLEHFVGLFVTFLLHFFLRHLPFLSVRPSHDDVVVVVVVVSWPDCAQYSAPESHLKLNRGRQTTPEPSYLTHRSVLDADAPSR